jgi:hypothetical protein
MIRYFHSTCGQRLAVLQFICRTRFPIEICGGRFLRRSSTRVGLILSTYAYLGVLSPSLGITKDIISRGPHVLDMEY